MGLKTTWLCVRRRTKAEVLEALGLAETGEFEGEYLADVAVAGLPDGWVVVHYGGAGKLKGSKVASLFPQGEVVWGTSSETVMWSGAYGLVDGARVWSVEHDPGKDPDGIQTTGAPPSAWKAPYEALMSQQVDPASTDVDYAFEAPMDLTRQLTGYDPTRQAISFPFVIATRAQVGKGSEAQTSRLRLNKKLAAAAKAELIPAAMDLGFRPGAEVPGSEHFFLKRSTLARSRGEWMDTLEFEHGVRGGMAKIAISFFPDRRGRGGSSGEAVVPPRRRSLLEWIAGRKPEPDDEAVARAVREARELLPHLDKHLKDGTPHPHIRPADCYDAKVPGEDV